MFPLSRPAAFFPGGILFLSLLSACADSSSSGPAHTRNEPTRQWASNPLDWAASSNPESDFQRLVAPALGRNGKPASFLPKDHLLVKRAQHWFDAIDGRLRELYPNTFAVIPRPRAQVWVSASPNGFAAPIQQCVTVPVRFAGQESGGTPLPIVGISFAGLAFAAKDDKCHKVESATPQDLVEWFTRNVGTCPLRVVNGEVEIGSGCRMAPALRNAPTSRALAFSTNGTSPLVTLTTALFGLLETEEQLVGVIAHELGHYYRSHPAMWTAKYNFFYRIQDVNPVTKPEPDPTLAELGERALKASRSTRPDEETKAILREAQERRLGYYTYEQEADELAAEWLAMLGLSPEVLVEKMFLFMRSKNIQDSEFEYGFETCSRLRASGWSAGKGGDVYVPIGNFSNPHHSLCYRAFNLDREILAHRYEISTSRVNAPDDVPWREVKAEALHVNAEAGAVGDAEESSEPLEP